MRDRPLCSICLIVFVGFCICIRAGGARFVEELRPSPLEQKVQRGEMIQFTGQVYQKEIKENDQVLYLKDVQVTYQKQSLNESRIIIHDETKQQFHIGNRITGSGEVSFYETSRNPGNFDPKLYYQRQKIHAYVWAQSMEITGEQEDRIQNGLYRLRKNWSQMLREVMGEKDGATFAAILLGEKSSMDKELKELYQVNGIAHILAISGVKTLKLDIPLVPETRINRAFVPLHIAIIYILKLCLDVEIIPRCRFPCSRGYLTKCINWQKKQ